MKYLKSENSTNLQGELKNDLEKLNNIKKEAEEMRVEAETRIENVEIEKPAEPAADFEPEMMIQVLVNLCEFASTHPDFEKGDNPGWDDYEWADQATDAPHMLFLDDATVGTTGRTARGSSSTRRRARSS